MAKNNALLAGELSCHFFFHDRYFGYDDGIYATLRLFELLIETNKRLDQLLEIIPQKQISPEIRIKCQTDQQKIDIVAHAREIFAVRHDVELLTIDGIRAQLPYGWGLLRASNTQPVICLRFEADTQENLKRIKKDFFVTLQPYFEEQKLKEYIAL
jgi:phosphomannomutase/phosphoglucomutase